MSAISSWLLSVACVIILGVLSEFVLPEGQINKYIKVIFSFIIILVIIMPLPKLFQKNFDFSKLLGGSENVLQEDYLYQVNLDKLTSLQEAASKKIQSKGLNKVSVSINANILTEKLEIYDVYVELCDIEYDKNFANKNISQAKEVIVEAIGEIDALKGVEVKFDE